MRNFAGNDKRQATEYAEEHPAEPDADKPFSCIKALFSFAGKESKYAAEGKRCGHCYKKSENGFSCSVANADYNGGEHQHALYRQYLRDYPANNFIIHKAPRLFKYFVQLINRVSAGRYDDNRISLAIKRIAARNFRFGAVRNAGEQDVLFCFEVFEWLAAVRCRIINPKFNGACLFKPEAPRKKRNQEMQYKTRPYILLPVIQNTGNQGKSDSTENIIKRMIDM